MDYKDKYLKYKGKYIELKKTIKDDDLILFMYLGNVPSSLDINEHYSKLMQCSSKSNKFKIIIHHMDDNIKTNIQNNINNYWFKDLDYDFVDDEHHVGTEWATNSLVFATLLMMQMSRKLYGNSIKKYVLLSPNCCPLFNFDELYYAFTSDSRSWLYFYSENKVRSHLSFANKNNWIDNDGFFDMFTNNYFSQWSALDREHVNYFFLPDQENTYLIEKENGIKKSYCKSGRPNNLKINNNTIYTSVAEDLKKLLLSFEFMSWDVKDTVNEDGDVITTPKPCGAVDEHFFGMYILYKLFKNHKKENYPNLIRNNLKTCFIEDILHRLEYLKKNISNELFEIDYERNINQTNYIYTHNKLKYKNILKDNGFEDNYKLHVPGTINLNPTKKKEYYITTDINGQKIYLARDETTVITKTKPSNIDYEESIKLKNIPVSCTYTDWGGYIADPENFCRGFNHPNHVDENNRPIHFNVDFKINEYLSKDNPASALEYILNADLKYDLNFHNDIDNLDAFKVIKSPWYHPVEYTCWNFQKIVNAYLLYTYFNKIFFKKKWHGLKKGYDQWQNIILNYLGNNNKSTEFADYNILDGRVILHIPIGLIDILTDNYSDTLKENVYGNFINTEYIENAISTGCLFIRKVGPNTGINLYTNILCKLNYIDLNKNKNRNFTINNKYIKNNIINSSLGSNGNILNIDIKKLEENKFNFKYLLKIFLKCYECYDIEFEFKNIKDNKLKIIQIDPSNIIKIKPKNKIDNVIYNSNDITYKFNSIQQYFYKLLIKKIFNINIINLDFINQLKKIFINLNKNNFNNIIDKLNVNQKNNEILKNNYNLLDLLKKSIMNLELNLLQKSTQIEEDKLPNIKNELSEDIINNIK